jgi:hypothetical protein
LVCRTCCNLGKDWFPARYIPSLGAHPHTVQWKNNLRYKPVALTRDCLHKPGSLGVITQDLADFADGGIDTVLGIYENRALPEAFGDFRSGDKIAVMGCQQNKQLHWLLFQFKNASCTPKFKAVTVEREFAELENCAGHLRLPLPMQYSRSRTAGDPV